MKCGIRYFLPVLVAVGMASATETVPRDQVTDYNAEVPKTILELQQFRHATSVRIKASAGKQGIATLVDLNPVINVWYLLKVKWTPDHAETAYHLENPRPSL
jgi:hypothetical protein